MRPLLVFGLLLGAVSSVRADLTVVGSDLLGDKFSAGVTEFAKQNKLAVKLALTGSREGLDSVQAGRADLALLVFSTKEKPPGAPFVAQPVAYHTAVVVVPVGLPLTQISFGQLRDIFCDNEGVAINAHWADLGVTNPQWKAGLIVPVLSGPGSGLAHDLFCYTVLLTPGLRTNVSVETNTAAALKHISAREGGLAILDTLPAASAGQFRVVPVARGVHDVAFLPTPENVQSGDYPIRLPLYVVFRAESKKALLPLLQFLYSAEAVPLWQDAQLVPLPPQARAAQIHDFETP